jgi:ABC-2 type transport system ATP-binding protein
VEAPQGARLLPLVVRALDDAQVPVEDIALRRPTLDEVFLSLTRRGPGSSPTPDPRTDPEEDAA